MPRRAIDHYQHRPVPPVAGELRIVRTLDPPNRRYRRGALYYGADGELSFAQQLHTIDALVLVTVPVVRFGRDPRSIIPTIEVRL